MPEYELAIVAPVYNEFDNLSELVTQVEQAMADQTRYQLVLVDDGSDDGSARLLEDLLDQRPHLKVVRHCANAGQSAALCSGVAAAEAATIVTIDGDLQNDPADIPRLLTRFRQSGGRVLVAGNRATRRDNWLRRVSSTVANVVRGALLGDGCPDTGCSLKVFGREQFLLLPQFDHMHRFLPALFAAKGIGVINVPVNHRPRVAGRSKYGVGKRLWVGIVDIFGVRWLQRRNFTLTAIQRQELRDDG